MKKTLIYLSFSLCIAGCTSNEPNLGDEQSSLKLTADDAKFLVEAQLPVKLDEREISQIIGDVVSVMDAKTPTRSGSPRTVSEIRPLLMNISTSTTRSGKTVEGSEEELFYAVNFENEEGYSVIAADRRIQDEIAIFVDQGNFPDEDTGNSGLKMMMSHLGDYATNSIVKYETWQDSVKTALMSRMDATSIEAVLAAFNISQKPTNTRTVEFSTGPSWHTNNQVEPLIPVEWGQAGVFNDTATQQLRQLNEIGSNEEVWAGCVAIATVQLMAYWKHPSTYHGKAIDWDTTIQYTGSRGNRPNAYKTWLGTMSTANPNIQKTISDYVWYIGRDINMDYGVIGVDGSSAYSWNAISLMKQQGYSAPTLTDYSKLPVTNSIYNGRPVYMEGRDPDGGAHAWLIDGYLEQHFWDMFFIDFHLYEINKYREFFHINWGWDGTDNGYYIEGLFDAINDPDLPSDTRSYNYRTGLHVSTNIYPI